MGSTKGQVKQSYSKESVCLGQKTKQAVTGSLLKQIISLIFHCGA